MRRKRKSLSVRPLMRWSRETDQSHCGPRVVSFQRGLEQLRRSCRIKKKHGTYPKVVLQRDLGLRHSRINHKEGEEEGNGLYGHRLSVL